MSERQQPWLPTYFYPRPPRGGRRGWKPVRFPGRWISIHALREEGDSPRLFRSLAISTFLSTPSARRATVMDLDKQANTSISIHALREEGDAQRPGRPQMPYYFYPRPPRGGRPRAFVPASTTKIFLSTPSVRRATCRSNPSRWYPPSFLSTPSVRRATIIER